MGRRPLKAKDARGVRQRLERYVTNQGGWIAFEQKTGLPHSSVDSWRRGVGTPELAHLLALARKDPNLNLHGLLTGVGPVYLARRTRPRFVKLGATKDYGPALRAKIVDLIEERRHLRQELANVYRAVRAMARGQSQPRRKS